MQSRLTIRPHVDCQSYTGSTGASAKPVLLTHQGIIQGRDAIQKDSDKRFQSRFRDLSITPLIVKTLNDTIWETGEWTMKIGDQPIRGYFAMTLVREGSLKIRDEIFSIAPPASPGPK